MTKDPKMNLLKQSDNFEDKLKDHSSQALKNKFQFLLEEHTAIVANIRYSIKLFSSTLNHRKLQTIKAKVYKLNHQLQLNIEIFNSYYTPYAINLN